LAHIRKSGNAIEKHIGKNSATQAYKMENALNWQQIGLKIILCR